MYICKSIGQNVFCLTMYDRQSLPVFHLLFIHVIPYIRTDAPNNVRVNPERQNVRVGDRHELVQCRGKGVPPPQYQWFFNGEVVSNSSQLPPEYDLKKDHHGNYTCIASNKHGQATKVAYINIVCKCNYADAFIER